VVVRSLRCFLFLRNRRFASQKGWYSLNSGWGSYTAELLIIILEVVGYNTNLLAPFFVWIQSLLRFWILRGSIHFTSKSSKTFAAVSSKNWCCPLNASWSLQSCMQVLQGTFVLPFLDLCMFMSSCNASESGSIQSRTKNRATVPTIVQPYACNRYQDLSGVVVSLCFFLITWSLFEQIQNAEMKMSRNSFTLLHQVRTNKKYSHATQQ